MAVCLLSARTCSLVSVIAPQTALWTVHIRGDDNAVQIDVFGYERADTGDEDDANWLRRVEIIADAEVGAAVDPGVTLFRRYLAWQATTHLVSFASGCSRST
jgi:hypothetical protein